ncbi:arsenosugar biosynthesis radical SAM (seleno)protein ArsS [Halochromatium salexigens]|uniref:Radical SAM protein n=1 Tax=Halochromatium salexigens TaxID=49447 RepID=A0AAJ0UEC1_HALSE|nr:arsenosugar biosynthesis radical SAM (seleno)protein ArsS [Halochromatium salexigens]MBK5929883.1 radical SAM protein [Halochromatium salexigens]
MLDTLPHLQPGDFPFIRREQVLTLQVNLGRLCNQQCLHCHVGAGPQRREIMDRDTLELVMATLERGDFQTLDLTGGAPELNPGFRDLVRHARGLGLRVIDRCNLTVLSEPGQEDLADFIADQSCELVASLPCYLETNVDAQRGRGVFDASLAGLQRLNALGYGDPNSALVLDLVFNPQGPELSPPQAGLEADYRRELFDKFGIRFNRLLTLANLPVGRFGSLLLSTGAFDGYIELLRSAHRAENLANVMCRSLISVDWQGWLYDCDFNQMLGLPLGVTKADAERPHLRDLPGRALAGTPIAVANHCYGCTAGQGSSCGGALTGSF